MGKALYRKYRSKKLSEIVGQEHITDTLERALKQGTISHAYLFTGPRGVGKTSIARILAHEVNGLPYEDESTHLDIIEIDAASNRRIDEIRELKERVTIAPTSAKYKVYIIDEVHMLTKEAFNALLKTLEEPPEHVIFILATTEAHKVPETIISRTQRFSFKPVPSDKVVAHLKSIAKTEKISIDEDALELLASHGEGSFRDSISLLDQIRHSSDHITLADVQQALGLAPEMLLNQIMSGLAVRDIKAIASALAAAQDSGIQALQLSHQLSQILRHDLLTGEPAMGNPETLQLLAKLLAVSASSDPHLALELALYGSILGGTDTPAPIPPTIPIPSTVEPKSTPKPEDETTPKPKPSTSTPNDELWQNILVAIKAKHNTLYSLTRMAVPAFEPGKVTLQFSFPFHQKRLSEDKNKQLLIDVINQATGRETNLELVVDSSAQSEGVLAKPEIKQSGEVNLETINNIFGSTEVLE